MARLHGDDDDDDERFSRHEKYRRRLVDPRSATASHTDGAPTKNIPAQTCRFRHAHRHKLLDLRGANREQNHRPAFVVGLSPRRRALVVLSPCCRRAVGVLSECCSVASDGRARTTRRDDATGRRDRTTRRKIKMKSSQFAPLRKTAVSSNNVPDVTTRGRAGDGGTRAPRKQRTSSSA